MRGPLYRAMSPVPPAASVQRDQPEGIILQPGACFQLVAHRVAVSHLFQRQQPGPILLREPLRAARPAWQQVAQVAEEGAIDTDARSDLGDEGLHIRQILLERLPTPGLLYQGRHFCPHWDDLVSRRETAARSPGWG